MNQGKLEVVKQEMARVNIDILGISELKWTEISKLNSDDDYIYDRGKESRRRNVLFLMAEQSNLHSQQQSEMQYLGAISKMT